MFSISFAHCEQIQKGMSMGRLSQTDLVKSVATAVDVPEAVAKRTVAAFVGEIQKNVKKGNTVNLHGFLTLESRKRKRFKSRNPRTGEAVMVPASTVVKVKVSSSFKAIMDPKKARKPIVKKAATKKKAVAKKVSKKATPKKATAKKVASRRKSSK